MNNNKPPQNPIDIAIHNSIDMFVSNWSKHDTFTWRQNMFNMCKASFKNWLPKSIRKAAAHVIQTNVDDYPPSMGKIIQTMKDYMGTASLRTAKIEACHRCNQGFRKLVFWIYTDTTKSKTKIQEYNAACSDCEFGTSRKNRLKMSTEIEMIQKINNLDILFFENQTTLEKETRLVNKDVKIKIASMKQVKYQTLHRYIWVQSKSNELPPLEMTARDENEHRPNTEHSSLLKERQKAKKEHCEKIYKLQEQLHAKQTEIAKKKNLKPPPKMKPFKYISMKEFLFANKLEPGFTYISKDENGREYSREE